MCPARADLGELLRQHRAMLGVTQEELAERAGISARAVSDMERGLRRRLYRDTVARLAAALQLDPVDAAEFQAAARGHADGGTVAAGPGGGMAPPPLNRLIGRDREVELIRAALRDGAERIVTVTGTGGVGKTRLAIEIAGLSEADFADGVAVVSLAATRETSLVAPTLVHALDVQAQRGSPFRALERHLNRRNMLLVLDNFEHLLEAGPLLVDLVATCPHLSILVTSRAPLRVTAEREIRLFPLAVPAEGATADAVAAPSIDLLIERMSAVNSEFDADGSDAQTLADIARRLEGIPLAIELAARRSRHLGLVALRDHLADRLDLLTHGPRDVPARHQTMRATIAWSYDLLDDDARRLLRTAAVFAGDCTLDGLAFVAGVHAGEALGAVSVLVDQSLVSLTVGASGEDRYGMLEVIREFAIEVSSGEDEFSSASARHAEFFVGLAEGAQPHLVGRSQDRWFARLDDDHDNFRVALRWLIGNQDADRALRLAGALWMFWRQHGDFAEGRRWLRQALDLPQPSPGPRLAALWGAAWLAYHQGDYDAMRTLTNEHLGLAREAGDAAALRNALTEQGMLLMADGHHADALGPFRDALDIARRLNHEWLVAISTFNLGHAGLHGGDPDEGERFLRDALERFRALGDRRFSARAQAQLAVAALLRGDAALARDLVVSSLVTFEELGEKWGVAEGLEILSAAAPGGISVARIAGAADALRAETATEPLPFDGAVIARLREAVQAGLSVDAWDTEWQRGRDLTMSEAVTYARSASR